MFFFTENLVIRFWKEFGEGGIVFFDRAFFEFFIKDFLKFIFLLSYRLLVSGDNRESTVLAILEMVKEIKESKK